MMSERDERFPYLQALLSELDPSDWTHQFRQVVARTDFGPGPIARFEERVRWGWVCWGFDSTRSYTVPRPEEAEAGQVWLSSVTVIRPGLNKRGRRDLNLATNLQRTALPTGHDVPETAALYGGVGGGVGLVGGVASAALIHPIGLAGLVLVPVGLVAGLGLRGLRVDRGRRDLAAWTEGQPTAVDVEESLAALAIAQERLAAIAAHADVADISDKIDYYRWNLIVDPYPGQEWVDTVQDTVDAIGAMDQTCQEIEQRDYDQRRQVRTEANDAVRAAWAELAPHATPGDGIAEHVQALTQGLREVYRLDLDRE